MSQTAIIAAIPFIALALVAVVVAFDILTNPQYVAERRAQRDKKIWVNRYAPKQHFPKTARNTSRHRRIY